MPVRTRFAPSPTGFLHVGSARTALFNWLYARHTKGTFIVRIEDTDKERSKKDFEDEILDSLKWLGMDWDDEVTHQSQRTENYRKHAERLLKEGKAFRDGDAIRFKNPEGIIGWEDIVRGRIEFDMKLIDPTVIMKSDGSPTYNFACVCDDAEMGITHIIRGEDHISNTPKQIPIYQALGLPLPQFAHIPLILGEDRSRLSKRHGATSIREYREKGYLAEAMVNYLCLLGWSPGENQEIISREETIQKFALEDVLSTGAIFNIQKMNWMNGEYLRAFSAENLERSFLKELQAAGLVRQTPDSLWMKRFSELYRLRVFVLKDLPQQADFFFKDEVNWDEEGAKILEKHKGIEAVFLKYAETLRELDDFGHETVETASRALMKELGLSGKQFIHPCRIALTGRTVSPGFFETVSLLGRERAVRRLQMAASRLAQKTSA